MPDSFVYPYPNGKINAGTFIGNHRLLATYAYPKKSPIFYLCVYDKLLGKWLEPVKIPCNPFDILVDLLGFVGDRSIAVVFRDYTGWVHLAIVDASDRFDQLSGCRRVQLYQGGDQISVFKSLRFPGDSFLIVDTTPENISVVEVTNEVATAPLRLNIPACIYVARYRKNLFAVTEELVENQLLLKLYTCDISLRMQLEHVPEFTIEPAPNSDSSFFFSCWDHWLLCMEESKASVHLFDLEKPTERPRQLGSPFSESAAPSYHLPVLPTGEALVTLWEGERLSGIQSVWMHPPRLVEVAIRCIHRNMPKKTLKRLHASKVHKPDELVKFLRD